MPRRALVAALAAALTAVLAACGSTAATEPAGDAAPSQATSGTAAVTGSQRTGQSGPITVTATITELTPQRARFTVVMDNHERDLTADPAQSATLLIGGRQWPDPSWQVAEATGHHLSGVLTFAADSGAPVNGRVELIIGQSDGGLPTPVNLAWDG